VITAHKVSHLWFHCSGTTIIYSLYLERLKLGLNISKC